MSKILSSLSARDFLQDRGWSNELIDRPLTSPLYNRASGLVTDLDKMTRQEMDIIANLGQPSSRRQTQLPVLKRPRINGYRRRNGTLVPV